MEINSFWEGFKKISSDKIPGGLSDNTKRKFNKGQVSKGVKVEFEHTDDREISKEITKDHLTEDKNYYKKLSIMEDLDLKNLEDAEKKASVNSFWLGFQKRANLMAKGQRADTSVGARPRSMVSSKGSFKPQPLPTAKKVSTPLANTRASLKGSRHGQIHGIRQAGPGVTGMFI